MPARTVSLQADLTTITIATTATHTFVHPVVDLNLLLPTLLHLPPTTCPLLLPPSLHPSTTLHLRVLLQGPPLIVVTADLTVHRRALITTIPANVNASRESHRAPIAIRIATV